MSTVRTRGSRHIITYTYKDESDTARQQWESYQSDLEAYQRKDYIDYLQKYKKREEIREAAKAYHRDRETSRVGHLHMDNSSDGIDTNTYEELASKWFLFHTRKYRLAPKTYDSYTVNLNYHIIPYFKNCKISTISAEDIDGFIDFLNTKPRKGQKRNPDENAEPQPPISSATVKKCFHILMMSLEAAKSWGYIKEVPSVTPPSVRYKKQRSWSPQQVQMFLDHIKDNRILHLATHFAFICSLRRGETAGISITSINFEEQSFWISQQVERISNESIKITNGNKVLHVFKATRANCKTRIALTETKTDDGCRKLYLPNPLIVEIKERINEIDRNKERYKSKYEDHGLLLCNKYGRPMDPKYYNDQFKKAQHKLNMHPQMEFQGLRKSGEMHKLRVSNNNYQLVAENGGHSPQVLMKHYNKISEVEKQLLTSMIERDFYVEVRTTNSVLRRDEVRIIELIFKHLQQNPNTLEQVMRLLQLISDSPPDQKT